MALTNSEIKLIKALARKKGRIQERLFVVEGEKLIDELIIQDRYEIDAIYGTQPLAHKKFRPISPKELSRISQLKAPNRFLATVSIPVDYPQTSGKNILMLDTVNDPGNLGTILRTADWFGITDIFLSNDSVDVFNPKVVQATMGAIFRTNVKYCKLENETKNLKKLGYKLVGACMNGKSYRSINFPEKCVLVMGSESHGISHELKPLLDEKITIDRIGQSESLNLGVATGILLAELTSKVMV